MKYLILSIIIIVLGLTGILLCQRPALIPLQVAAKNYSYADTLTAITKEISRYDKTKGVEECAPILLNHGTQTKKALLLFHGYTNCPKQFERFAQLAYGQGYNVYVPLLPHHGLKKPFQNELHTLTAQEITNFADQQTDIAMGLGDHLTILGLSEGGNMAIWESERSSEVYRSIAIAPVIYPQNMNGITRNVAINALSILPPFFIWWDQKLKDAIITAPYAYHYHSSKATAELLSLGVSNEYYLKQGFLRSPITFVINPDDEAISYTSFQKMYSKFSYPPWKMNWVDFPQKNLPHDVIDIHNNSRAEEVYTFLLTQVLGNGNQF